MLGFITRSRFMVLSLGLLLSVVCPKAVFALTWVDPPIVFDPGPSSGGTDLAADLMGNAFTTWVVPGLNNQAFASRFSSTTGTYGPAVTVYTGAVSSIGIGDTHVATDASQTALLLVQDFDAAQLIAAFYDGITWQAPIPLYTFISPLGFNAFPSLAMDGSGNGLAAWREASGPTPPGDIYVSFFDGGSQTWGSPQVITPGGTGGTVPQVGYSANGDAVAVWLDALGNVIASNYDGGSMTWTAVPVTISVTPAAPPGFIPSLFLGIDSAGNAVALWIDNASSELFSSSYVGGVWSAPQTVSSETGVIAFDFAMSSGGTAIAVWSDGAFAGQYSIYSVGAWSFPVAYNPNAVIVLTAIDTVGNALLTADDTSQTFSYTLPVGGPLSPPDIVGNSADLSGDIAAYSDNGRGFISGTVRGGESSSVSGTFSSLPAPPPTPGSISGRVCKNKFANASERVKIITWVPFPDPSTVSYYLRRNGKLIAIIPDSGSFKYEDQRRCKSTDVYVVTSVDAAGVETNPLTVSIK